MLTFLSSRARLVVVPVVAAGALIALAAGANAASGDALTSSIASATGKCAPTAVTAGAPRHSTCGSTAKMAAEAAKFKVRTPRQPLVAPPITKPVQSAGTPGDRARWQAIQAALAARG